MPIGDSASYLYIKKKKTKQKNKKSWTNYAYNVGLVTNCHTYKNLRK